MTDTFPRLMLAHAKQRPDAPALREKEYGIWQTLTWSQLALLVRRLARAVQVRAARAAARARLLQPLLHPAFHAVQRRRQLILSGREH